MISFCWPTLVSLWCFQRESLKKQQNEGEKKKEGETERREEDVTEEKDEDKEKKENRKMRKKELTDNRSTQEAADVVKQIITQALFCLKKRKIEEMN